MMIAARRALIVGDTREAVLEAATAVELALASAIERRLAANGLHPDAIEDRLRATRMLGPLLRLAKQLDVPVSEHVYSAVVEPRNRVIHAGWRPNVPQTGEIPLVAR